MRNITLIVVHCSANRAGSTLGMADIDRWHRQRGWNGCGYHYVVDAAGRVEQGRPVEQMGAHCRGHNRHSIGVCYVGGLSADGTVAQDTRTDSQRRALRSLMEDLHRRWPRALIVGHADLDPGKPHCPGYDVVAEYADLQPR